MARSKKKSAVAGKRDGVSTAVEEMDDIDLLNLYRYPESFPEKLQQDFRNSKSAQKRVEELLREIQRSNPGRPVKGEDERRQNLQPQAYQEGRKDSPPVDSSPGEASFTDRIIEKVRKLIR